MLFFIFHLLSLTSLLLSAFALPLVRRDPNDFGATTVSQADVSHYNDYTYFASSGYCKPESIKAWNCQACKKLGQFKVYESGGDGALTQYYYVGYWPTQKAVVVVYQGTDPAKIIPLITDARITFDSPNTSDPKKLKLFNHLENGAQIHSGFKSAFKKSHQQVLDAVRRAVIAEKTTKIIVIGHSLGGAIATVSAASMRSILGPTYQFKVVTYGAPRVGNAQWTEYVDKLLPDFSRIVNKRDPIPTVPGQSFRYVANKGEIHITDDGQWNKCPGNDNTNAKCTKNAITTRFKSSLADHSGPYNGISMGLC